MIILCASLLLASQSSDTDTLWTETAEGYSISVRYPEVALENQYIGERLQEYSDELVTRFRDGFQEYYYPEIPVDWELEIFFAHQPSSENLICIMAWVYEYSGGAHPNTWSMAFNYDSAGSTFLSPVELLGGEAEFEAFAQEVMQQLYDELGEDGWVEDGASPDEENYHSLLPVPDDSGGIGGYLVYFPPYQVACYACGPLDVYIPVE